MSWTPARCFGFAILCACSAPTEHTPPHAPEAPPRPAPAAAPATETAPAAPETALGIADTGIWSDLDPQVQLSLPAHLDPAHASALLTADGKVLLLYVDDWPTKAYPVLDAAASPIGLRAGDAAELAGLVDLTTVPRLAAGHAPPPGDRDGDDLPDPLDILIGAKKAAIQAGKYGGEYITLHYPGGDVPRTMGVCSDVVVRSMRNAGVDLQREVHEDIARSPKSYPMVKGKGDPNIDQRRVRTLLPWFERHAHAHVVALDDASDPYRPGDIVFLDTFPDRPGPDHIGVVTDTIGESGHLLVINAWTDGYVTQPMDLLGWVPVTERFRL